MKFPHEFTTKAERIESGVGAKGDDAINALYSKGYIVATGLTRYFAGAISTMSQQDHVREHCPNDSTGSRFATEKTTEKWLKKGGGRAVFLLLERTVGTDILEECSLAGYGWTGRAQCDELPSYPVTSAYRLGKNALGKQLAGDFIQAVVSATGSMYASSDSIGLETWQSNRAARLYPKLGFELVTSKIDWRPTLDPCAQDGQVMDTRLFMGYVERPTI